MNIDLEEMTNEEYLYILKILNDIEQSFRTINPNGFLLMEVVWKDIKERTLKISVISEEETLRFLRQKLKKLYI